MFISNWESIEEDAITHLQNLIRINTTNPPGNEIAVVKYLAEILTKLEIPFEIFEPAPGRASLIARVKGTGNKKPLLLTSHIDVVPAELDKWERHPFSGDIHNGCIWGRGAVDMKHMTAMELMMLVAIKKNRLKLKRDVIFAALADEEAGCEWGAKWLVTNKPYLLESEVALNEVGGFSLPIDNHIFYPIGVAERGYCWFKLTAKGDPGHGSLPHDNQAVVKIGEAAHNLGRKNFPYHAHPLVKTFLGKIEEKQSGIKKIIFKLLRNPIFNKLIINNFIPKEKRKTFNPLFRNTASPTIIEAGQKINVIPSIAELKVDGRILPGQTVESFVNELHHIIGHDYELEIIRGQNPTEIDYKNDFFKLLSKSLQNHDKEAIPVPYMIPGFTDASWLSKLGIKCYGFTPLKLDKSLPFAELFHGHNERVPVEAVKFGLKVMWDVVSEFCEVYEEKY